MTTNTFGHWLKRKYLDWAITQLEEQDTIKNQVEFAKWLNISNTNLSQYFLDKRKPNEPFISILAEKLGMEVYDQLGLSRKIPDDENLKYLCEIWHKLSEDEKKKLS